MIGNDNVDASFEGKSVLITGICGTVGKEVLRQLVTTGVKRIVGLDINENETFALNEEYRDESKVSTFYGSLRDRESLNQRLHGIDIVIHTAALKHVPVCESSPRDAVLTNIVGTTNLIDAAREAGVERVLFTSSDKAVNPTNVMGTSKLMGERLMTAATGNGKDGRPILASTRFGNVLGSRGSVVPIFRECIEKGRPLRLTHTDMTRFIMTLEEAVHLVLKSVFLARGGEVFVTKMPVVRIEDLAYGMVEELASRSGHKPEDIPVDITGTRPGEKMYEELFNDEETRRTLETDEYFVILPALDPNLADAPSRYPGSRAVTSENPYNSAFAKPMSREELKTYLNERGLLD